MKIIEAMKLIKANKEKILDLHRKINTNAANLSYETPAYPDTAATVRGWVQAALDISQENVRLLVAIQRTNLSTLVTIELGGQRITKSIAEWVWRRREYANLDRTTMQQLGDRGLKEAKVASSVPGGEALDVKIVRHYDPLDRDEKLAVFQSEAHVIDGTLEVINATTELME